MKQDFTVRSLLQITNKKDIIKFDLGRKKDVYAKKLQSVSDDIVNDGFKIIGIKHKKINTKVIYYTELISEYYALKKISIDLKRLYKIKTQNRDDISEQVLRLLETSSDYGLLRLDIKSFYESIDYKKILAKLKKDKLLSSKSLNILEDIQRFNFTGLPRGLSISPVLSEIFMRYIDERIREIPGVYYYSRYVDDMFLFVTKESKVIYDEINKILLKDKLLFNNKVYYNDVPKVYDGMFSCSFDYLGYKFTIRDFEIKNKREVSVSLSDDKIRKIKTRIIHSLLDCALSTENILVKSKLLKKRIDFLSGNYPLPSDKTRTGKLKGGIYYSNRLVTNTGIFEEFNRFLRKSIYTRRNNFFGKAMRKISPSDKNIIDKICFRKGFESRKFLVITEKDMKKIKSCWHHKNHKRIKSK